jgi:hypothetical protein
MAEHATTVDIARAFTEAWTSHDMNTAARHLAEDVVFDGPVNRTRGKNAYIEALNRFAQAVTGLKMLAAFDDDSQALIMYDVTTGPFGTLTCAELLTFRDGKIGTDLLTFDTYPMRKAQGG